MTHHTRQSALGLPIIKQKNYFGKEYDISEYTMSEIIASVYILMEETGIEEGILFLDEINCVSETLAPIMLQFLQYKIFGRHKVPDGWIVVTAGNPPEYNNSVREFDIVTWDRLKRIDVEPDFNVWKEYAYYTGVHPSVITYLDIKKPDFYSIKSTVDGKSFVTARGWDDLSKMIRVYELKNIEVDEDLIRQYIQDKKIAKSFSNYYQLFRKYQSDYQVETILAGKASDEIKRRAEASKFDERLSLLGLMIDALVSEVRYCINTRQVVLKMQRLMKDYKTSLEKTNRSPSESLLEFATQEQKILQAGKKSGSMSRDDIYVSKTSIEQITKYSELIIGETDKAKAIAAVRKEFNKDVKELKKIVEKATNSINNIFAFTNECFGTGQEVLILTTELTANYYTAKFIGEFGGGDYNKYNQELLFYERKTQLIKEIDALSLEDDS